RPRSPSSCISENVWHTRPQLRQMSRKSSPTVSDRRNASSTRWSESSTARSRSSDSSQPNRCKCPKTFMRRAGSTRSCEGSRSARWSRPSKNTRPSASACCRRRRSAEPRRESVSWQRAKAARRLLDVRLADVRRRAVLAVARVAFHQGRLEELAEVAAEDLLAQHALEAREQASVAGEEARLLHGGAAREVRARHRDAVVERAEAVADVEPEVPERVEQLLHHPLHVRRHLAVVDDHEVHVRERMELAAA